MTKDLFDAWSPLDNSFISPCSHSQPFISQRRTCLGFVDRPQYHLSFSSKSTLLLWSPRFASLKLKHLTSPLVKAKLCEMVLFGKLNMQLVANIQLINAPKISHDITLKVYAVVYEKVPGTTVIFNDNDRPMLIILSLFSFRRLKLKCGRSWNNILPPRCKSVDALYIFTLQRGFCPRGGWT